MASLETSSVDPGFAKGADHGQREPITGVWGQSPQLGPGPRARAPGGGQGRAESFSSIYLL